MIENKNSSTIENLTLVYSGEDYFSRFEQIILDAKTEIHIQTYIFEKDDIGKKIIAALKVATSRNVKIYILIDGFGSFSFPKELIRELNHLGINFRFFSPYYSANSIYLGRRLHHKVVVVDSNITLIGGINIADKYHGTATAAPWLDYAVLLKDEKMGKSLSENCMDIFYRKKRISRKKINATFRNFEDISVNILKNDRLKRKTEISTAYIKSFRSAKKEIVIVASYFLPGKRLINALTEASRKKVIIKLILTGISDVPIARRASCHLYSKTAAK